MRKAVKSAVNRVKIQESAENLIDELGDFPLEVNGESPAVNGKSKKESAKKVIKRIEIQPLNRGQMTMTLIGDRPLMTNNKLFAAAMLARKYRGPGGKSGGDQGSGTHGRRKVHWVFLHHALL